MGVIKKVKKFPRNKKKKKRDGGVITKQGCRKLNAYNFKNALLSFHLYDIFISNETVMRIQVEIIV